MEPGLRTYVLKRVGFAVLMLVGVSIVLFTIMRLAPGRADRRRVLAGSRRADPPAAGARPAARAAVSRLGRRGPSRRPRALVQDGRSGLGADPRPPRPDRAAHLRRARPGLGRRGPARRARGGPARHDLGHPGLGGRVARRVVPELLARDHADPPLLRGRPPP